MEIGDKIGKYKVVRKTNNYIVISDSFFSTLSSYLELLEEMRAKGYKFIHHSPFLGVGYRYIFEKCVQ